MTPEDAEALASIPRRSYARASATLTVGWPESSALTAGGIAELLGRHRYAVLPTARPDGRALAAPVGFLERPWLARHGHAPDWAAALVGLAPERVFSHAA